MAVTQREVIQGMRQAARNVDSFDEFVEHVERKVVPNIDMEVYEEELDLFDAGGLRTYYKTLRGD